MRKGLLTGVVAFMGLAAPAGVLAAISTTAASVAPAVSTVSSTALPVLYHQPLLGKHLLSVSLHGPRQTTDVQSANWGGYADIASPSGGADTFQTLSASWVEPKVTCTATHGGLLGIGATRAAYSSFWVGLDGYSSSSVEQTGTDSDCGSNGVASYYAWYEMYPAGSVDLSTTQFPVSPLDSMTAMVMSNAADTQFTLFIKDNTKGWHDSIPETSSGSLARSSAEFVAEAPSQCSLLFCSELPLANFGSVTFTGASVADIHNNAGNSNINTFGNAQMTMVDNGTTLATPTGDGSGSSFSVNWNS